MIINNEEFGYVHINTTKLKSEMTEDEIEEIYEYLRKHKKERHKLLEQRRKVMESKITDRTKV